MKLYQYSNGNATITIYDDGSREIEYENTLSLEYPLNIDIRVSTKCSFGLNPKTGKAFCDFCHESATTNGKECNYEELQQKLQDLPQGIELAIGANNVTPNLVKFISWCYEQDYIVNLTINQGHLKRDAHVIESLIKSQVVKGLGVSYRSSLKFDIPQFILDYSNTVFHVIAGIDSFDDVKSLHDKGVKKILILGEKDFGFNQGKVDLTSEKHKHWFWYVRMLFDMFEVVSFDNLALEQLKISRFFTKENWNTFYQGEHSFYIDAVNRTFAPSSRSKEKTDWNEHSISSYFATLVK